MRARAIDVDWTHLPSDVAPFISESQTFVTVGKEYEVHAVSVYRHVVFLLIVDDLNATVFVPALIFEILCQDMPADWICGVITKSGVDVVVGPDFVARDLDAYCSMVDMESDSVDNLWRRIEAT